MSTRHRWLAVYLALTVCLPFPCSLPAKPSSPAAHLGSGAIGLGDLIALALQNDPELVELRLNLPVEEARKRAAWQWRDPEIRFAYSKDANVQLDRPYTRSGISTERIGGSSDRTDTDTDGSTNERNSSGETRKNRYKETVTPGANSTKITREETEVRNSNSNTTKTSRGDDPTKESRSETERLNSRTEETRYDSRDPFARDESAAIKARFWIPNPFEMKQRVKRAAKEVDLATYKVTQAERRVILRVREEYEKLQYLHKKLQASRAQIPVIRAHIEREKALFGPGTEFTIDQSRFENIEIPMIEIDILNAQMELENAKRLLAMRVGLSDGSRIRLTDPLLRSTIKLQGTDLDYLTRMAFAFRGEIGLLKHEQSIAESELAILKAKKIPTISFLEAAYGRSETGGYHTNDEYGFQLGLILPLFSWIAKDEKIVEARIEAHYGSLKANETNIANEVAEAYHSVKRSASHRNAVEATIAEQKALLDKTATALDRSPDLAAKENLRYRIESKRSECREGLIDADRIYNRSLIRLEQALGADIDQVFSVKFETIHGGPDREVSAAALASSTRMYAAPKAKPVQKPLELKSQKRPAAETKPEKKKRWGLLTRPKKKAFSRFKNK